MKVYLLRHGESEDNLRKVYSRPNCSLTEKGREEIRVAGEYLKTQPIERVFVSPFLRALESWEILNLTQPMEVLPELHELYFGKFTGLTYEEARGTYQGIMDRWMADPFNHKPPEGESLKEAYERVKKVYDNLSKMDEDVLCVCHEGVIRLLVCALLGGLDHYFKVHMENGSVTTMVLNGEFSYLSQLNYKMVTTF